MPDARRLLIDLAIICGVGLVLAVLGPFGSFAAPFASRLGYWVAIVLAGYACYLPATVAATRVARTLALPEGASWAVACLVATVPMSLVTCTANGWWYRADPATGGEWLSVYANVLVLGSAITAIFWFGRHRRGTVPSAGPEPARVEVPAPAPTPPAARTARFADRLPPHLGDDLIALEMEDHYVRAHTPLGSTLILMRMRDAVAELEAIDGRLVHRSWWVARSHVIGGVRDGRNLRLTLTGGIEAPVARGQVEALLAAGWPARTATVPPRAAIG